MLPPTLSELRRIADDSGPPAALDAIRPTARALAAEEGADFRALIGSLPAESWQHDPVIAAAMGVSYRSAGTAHTSAAIGYFHAAEAGLEGADRSADPARVAVWLGHAAALRTLGRLDEALSYISRAHALDGPGGVLSVPVRVELGARTTLEHGMIELHLGHLDAARRYLGFALGLAAENLTRAEHVEALGGMAIIEYASGDFAASDRYRRRAAELAAGTSLEASAYAAPAAVAESLVAIDRHDLETAAELEPRLLEVCAGSDFAPFGLVVAGYLRLAARRLPEGLDLLERARQGFKSWAPPGLGHAVEHLLRAGMLVALDQGDEAWAILRRLAPLEHHILCPARVVAQLRLGHGDVIGAAAALAECEKLGDEHAPRTMLEVRLVRAAIEFERGEFSLSDIMFDRALVGMVRTGSRAALRIVPPATLAGLATRALARPHGAAAAKILQRIADATREVEREIEPLSSRELLVLAEVEKGSTVGGIAAALYISPNTVKTHLRRVYRKLGVATRADAIRKAKSLGLGREITPESPVPQIADS